MTSIVLSDVSKSFGGKDAVRGLDLEIQDGEFVIIVGPSGCGKTTTLRMLAGFERPSIGTIRMGDRVMNNVAPKDRNLAMVFQSYALFPHMTVAKNLAFGMRIRRVSKRDVDRQVIEVAGVLGIDGLLGRKPAELSGGERQRVALGRALLRKPDAFLLDEPLSNLDAALRAQMRLELKRIHQQYGITTVYVTHDQVEAMTMADRIALMSGGELQQYGAPDTIYRSPSNIFVAGFIGAPKINLVQADLFDDGGAPQINFLSITTAAHLEDPQHSPRLTGHHRRQVTVGIRPEDLGPAGQSGRRLPTVEGIVEVVEPLGAETHVAVRVSDQLLMCRFPARTTTVVGARIDIEVDVTHLQLFDDSGTSLTCSDLARTAPALPPLTNALPRR